MTIRYDLMTQKEAQITGRRFCTSCQWTRPVEGGKKIGPRWICAGCLEKKRNRIPSDTYKAKR